jgi:hypothetical protein
MKTKQHLTHEGLAQIKKIKEGMNTGRLPKVRIVFFYLFGFTFLDFYLALFI